MSAADDDTRKGEAITDAMATRSVKPKADGSDSIALAAISHRRSFRGRASGAREYRSTDCYVALRNLFFGYNCLSLKVFYFCAVFYSTFTPMSI